MTFQRLSVWERFLDLLRPGRRRERELLMKAAMRYIVEHPDEPVIFL